MYKKLIYLTSILLSLFQIIECYGQNSFSYLISTPDDERIYDAAEDEYGNYIMVGGKYSAETSLQSAYMIVLNSDGDIIYEHEFNNEDSTSYFGIVYFKNDSIIIFGVKRSAYVDNNDELWVLILDHDFNIIRNTTYLLAGYTIVDCESIINHKGNYLICGMMYIPPLQNDIFFFELTPSGDSVNRVVENIQGQQMEFDLIEKNNGGYKVFARGLFPDKPQTLSAIAEFDTAFNFISSDTIPYDLLFNHSAKWLNDSSYFVTGNKRVYSPLTRTDIGIIKVNTDNDLITGNHFGKTGDTISYVGACSNLDFLTPENIYFGGASNIFPEQGLFQIEDSWLMLTNIDSNLNLNWQKFYGGDAAYYLWGLKATNDGGCLLLSTRYDADIQDHEFDIYILKVDSTGLLTSTKDYPSIPVQQLSISPNPTEDYVKIGYPDIFGNDEKEIVLYNTLGTPVRRINATDEYSQKTFDISDLPGGLYFIVLYVNGKKTATGKAIKI